MFKIHRFFTDLKNIGQIQEKLLNKSPLFKSHLQSLNSLHLTLMLTKVNETNIEKAKSSLKKATSDFRKKYLKKRQFSIEFNGINAFSNSALYSDVIGGELLITKLHDTIKAEFKKQGFPSVGEYSKYHPHMTIVALDYNSRRLSKYWSDFLGLKFEFGVENVETLQICSMEINGTTQDYKILFETNL